MNRYELWESVLRKVNYMTNRAQYAFFWVLALLVSPFAFVCSVLECWSFITDLEDKLQMKLMALTWM